MVSIAILAGGQSVRFKNKCEDNKIFLTVNGTGSRLVEIIHDRYKPLTNDIFFQTSATNAPIIKEIDPGYNVNIDEIPNKGPMCGIYSALRHAKYDRVFVVAADMPDVDVNIFNELSNYQEFDCVVPKWRAGYLEPLCAIYTKRLITMIGEWLENNKLGVCKMVNSITGENVKFVNINELIEQKKINENCFTNINYPKDINCTEK